MILFGIHSRGMAGIGPGPAVTVDLPEAKVRVGLPERHLSWALNHTTDWLEVRSCSETRSPYWRRPLRPEANARCRLPPLLLSLTCLAPSVDVRWRPLLSVAVVTQLVTHRLRV